MTIRISVARVPDRCTVLRCDVCGTTVIVHQSDHRYGAAVREFMDAHEECGHPVDVSSAGEELQDQLARARRVVRRRNHRDRLGAATPQPRR